MEAPAKAARALYSSEARRKLRDMVKAFRPESLTFAIFITILSPSVLWELKALGIPVMYHLNDFKTALPQLQHGFKRSRHASAAMEASSGTWLPRAVSRTAGATVMLGSGGLSSQMAATPTKPVWPVPRSQPLCEGEVGGERMGRDRDRRASAFPEISAHSPADPAERRADPVFRSAFTRKRIDRSVTRHALPALREFADRGRGLAEN